jgi:hypothetical protein
VNIQTDAVSQAVTEKAVETGIGNHLPRRAIDAARRHPRTNRGDGP